MARRFARFFEKRHGEYVRLICRVQAFIIKVKQAEKDLRTQKAKEVNPLDSKDKEKIVVPMRLQYEHNMQNAMQMKAREPRGKSTRVRAIGNSQAIRF